MIPQPKVSAMMRGDFTNLSAHKLMDCLNRLGYDIEINVRPSVEPIGHLTLSTARLKASPQIEARNPATLDDDIGPSTTLDSHATLDSPIACAERSEPQHLRFVVR